MYFWEFGMEGQSRSIYFYLWLSIMLCNVLISYTSWKGISKRNYLSGTYLMLRVHYQFIDNSYWVQEWFPGFRRLYFRLLVLNSLIILSHLKRKHNERVLLRNICLLMKIEVFFLVVGRLFFVMIYNFVICQFQEPCCIIIKNIPFLSLS